MKLQLNYFYVTLNNNHNNLELFPLPLSTCFGYKSGQVSKDPNLKFLDLHAEDLGLKEI